MILGTIFSPSVCEVDDYKVTKLVWRLCHSCAKSSHDHKSCGLMIHTNVGHVGNTYFCAEYVVKIRQN